VALLPIRGEPNPVPLGPALTEAKMARGQVEREGKMVRQAAVLFLPGTTADLIIPDPRRPFDEKLDRKEPLGDSMRLWLLEHTVGRSGMAAMPADLPPGTDYTYQVSFVVQEARDKKAAEVRFSQPVYSYTEDFLGFPVGSIVPSGSYNYRKARWEAEDNGRVIEILGVNDRGEAMIDATGRGEARAVTLRELGFTSAELVRLAREYPKGARLWRVPLTHFSDYNWAFAPPPDAIPPPTDKDVRSNSDPDPMKQMKDGVCSFHAGEAYAFDGGRGSLDCRRQTVNYHYVLPNTAGKLKLHVNSRLAPSYLGGAALEVPLTTDVSMTKVPDSLHGIEVRIDGFRSDPYLCGWDLREQPRPLHPGLHGWREVISGFWNGRDRNGNPVGVVDAAVRIDYLYPADYLAITEANERAFGKGPGYYDATKLVSGGGRGAYRLYHSFARRAVQANPSLKGQPPLSFLSLNVRHHYADGWVFPGTGEPPFRAASSMPFRVEPYAGTGMPGFGKGGDVVRSARAALLREPGALLHSASQGSVFLSDTGNCLLRRITGEQIEPFAGLEPPEGGSAICGKPVPVPGPQGANLQGIEGLVAESVSDLVIGAMTRENWVLGFSEGTVFVVAGTGGDTGTDAPRDPMTGKDNLLGLVVRGPRGLALLDHDYGDGTLQQALVVAERERLRVLLLPKNPTRFGKQGEKDPMGKPKLWPALSTILSGYEPTALASAGDKLYVVQTNKNCIIELDTAPREPAAWMPKRVFGACGASGSYKEGSPGDARFNKPTGIAWDRVLNHLYVMDSGNAVLRRIDLASGASQLIAGEVGQTGRGCTEDMPAGAMRFGAYRDGQPLAGVAVISSDLVLVNDPTNARACAVKKALSLTQGLGTDDLYVVQNPNDSREQWVFYRGPGPGLNGAGPNGEAMGEHLRTTYDMNREVYRFIYQGVARTLSEVRTPDGPLLFHADGTVTVPMGGKVRLQPAASPNGALLGQIDYATDDERVTLQYEREGLPRLIQRVSKTESQEIKLEYDETGWVTKFTERGGKSGDVYKKTQLADRAKRRCVSGLRAQVGWW
jgi:hypothetical protein